MTQVSAAAIETARRLADEVLFPSAMDVEKSGQIPIGHLEELAKAGLYGIAGPARYGGLDAEPAVFWAVVEALAAGCLATTFVWLQHHSAVGAVAAAGRQPAERWLGPLCRGQLRAGIALGGAQPGPPLLRARRADGGFVLDGTSPWVTGWSMIDLVYTVARADDDLLVGALIPAVGENGPVSAEPVDLVAVNASRTVELRFTGCFVPAEAVVMTMPQRDWLARDAIGLRTNGSLALGLAARCCALLGPSPFDQQLAGCRAGLDLAGPAELPAARAAAAELAFRVAGALIVQTGSRAIRTGEHPQRLAREALFLLVFATRPPIKAGLARRLAAGPAASSVAGPDAGPAADSR
jgi:alkylation response protein AidB-like acyl-CoA dehydrogenase